jgi:hypothetical protein
VPRPATPAPASRATPPANGRRSIRARLSRPEPASRSGFSLAHDDRHQAAIMDRRPLPRRSLGLCSRPASSTPRWTLLSLRSVRPAAPHHCRFAPGQAFSTPRARCPDFCPSIPVSLRLFASPSGCRPLRITACIPICYREARLPKQSGLSLLPAFSVRRLADLRSRSVTVSEAGCSSNLLEPLQSLPSDSQSQSDSKLPILETP